MAAQKILVVDDEPDLTGLLAHHLKREGFSPIIAVNGTEALSKVKGVSLVVMDWMMPGLDGLSVLKRLRAQEETAALPVILLTARDEESDKVLGLELGADDYVTKPFSPKELIARIKALLRRSDPIGKTTVYSYQSLTLNLTRHEVTLLGSKVALTAKEFSLLLSLLQNKGHVLTRDYLLNAIWGYEYFGTTRTVDVHIRRLREKIPFLSKSLETVPSLGYKLSDAV
ncbi:MAG: response regulator transcription factor [Nitrospirota bacterium]